LVARAAFFCDASLPAYILATLHWSLPTVGLQIDNKFPQVGRQSATWEQSLMCSHSSRETSESPCPASNMVSTKIEHFSFSHFDFPFQGVDPLRRPFFFRADARNSRGKHEM
jgi:hypothetical protein